MITQPYEKFPPQQPLEQVISPTKIVSTAGSSLVPAGAPRSVLTDDVPSCSTSPSTNNGGVLTNSILNRTQHCNTNNMEKTSNESTKLNHNIQKEGVICALNYINNTPQMDYLDTSSSATSVCLSQTDGPSQPGFSMPSFNQQQLFKEAFPETEFQDTDMKNDALFGGNFESQFGIPLTADALLKNGIDCEKYENHFPENVVAAYSNKSKDGQQELSSSMISQSFGVQDMALNSIDSVISESAFLNRKTRAQAPSMQRKKTFTKVCSFNSEINKEHGHLRFKLF